MAKRDEEAEVDPRVLTLSQACANLVKSYHRDVEAYVADIKKKVTGNFPDPGCYAASKKRQPASGSRWK